MIKLVSVCSTMHIGNIAFDSKYSFSSFLLKLLFSLLFKSNIDSNSHSSSSGFKDNLLQKLLIAIEVVYFF